MPYDADLSKVLMTLNAISYESENPLPNEPLDHHQQRIKDSIVSDLNDTSYATAGQWQLVWGPGLTVGNMMYLTKQNGTNNYALSIRGTDWKFIIDWVEDVDILQLVPFPYISTANPNVRVAKGTMDGLMALASMTAPPINPPEMGTVTPAAISLLQFLSLEAMQSPSEQLNVYVTGHSLGGALAAVVGPWLDYQTSQWQHTGNTDINVGVYTYAGPSAGNADFAQYCGQIFPDSYMRVFNELDVVPLAWQQLGEVATWYVPSPSCPIIVKIGIDALGAAIAHDVYTQPQTPQGYSNQVNPADTTFWNQLAFQHDQNTYLKLLGAPPVSFNENGAAASLQSLANALSNVSTAPLVATPAVANP